MMMALTLNAQKTNVEKQLERLDSLIQQKETFDKGKQERLARLKIEERKATDATNKYLINHQLYDEYKSFKFDSAYHYALASARFAEELGNPNYLTEAGCGVVFCYLSAGLMKEACDAMKKVTHAGADKEHQKLYYETWTRLYYDLANYVGSAPLDQPYIDKGNLYTDSLMPYLAADSPAWLYANAMRQMKSHQFNNSVETFKKLVASNEADVPMLAIAYSCIGWSHWLEGREDEAICSLVESALCDTRYSIKENTATCNLANILYKRGDIRRAVSYAQSAMEDANFYGARHRKIEVGNILPIIEEDRYTMMKRERNLSIATAAIAALFIIGLLVGTFIISKQIKKLNKAQRIIDERNHSLEQTNHNLMEAQRIISDHNEALQQANERLEEADKIKTVYIGKTFYLNAQYINKVEKLYKMVDRKITARQYDDLRSQLKESTLISERQNMFADFDETFLKLFPDFVEKFNMLFDEKDRRYPETSNSLTNEMRIYALIRLGVNDSERIANFLDYSVHTVNTYKTRIKNRSNVENERFEQEIMRI